MKNSKHLVAIIVIFCFAFPVLAGESGSADQDEKELKRVAHRLRIPKEQLENARSALQEATDLALTLDPFPTSKISSIVSDWKTLQPSKAESTIEYFILELQLRALIASDEKSYIQATSTATSILRSLASTNYRKARELLAGWPYPDESFGDAAIQAFERMQSSVTQSIMQQMAKENPEALDEESLDSQNLSTQDLLTMIRNMANTGNREKVDELIDRAVENLQEGSNQTSNLAMALPWTQTLRYMDNSQVEKLLDHLVPMMQQGTTDRINASMTVSKGDVEMQLSPSENGLLLILRGLTSRPRFLNEILDKYPEFEAKFDAFGGIDDYLSNGSYLQEAIKSQTVIGSMPLSAVTGYDSNEPQELMEKLKDKAADEPQWVEQELRKSVEDPGNINLLTSLASRSAREYPELAEIALEIAEEMLPQIEDLQKQFSALQSLISAYRNLDGEVDEDLFKKGYILIDQIKEAQAASVGEMPSQLPMPQRSLVMGNTDRLEASLVADLARQDYDKAIDYVHSMAPGEAKLDCLIQIARALRQNNF